MTESRNEVHVHLMKNGENVHTTRIIGEEIHIFLDRDGTFQGVYGVNTAKPSVKAMYDFVRAESIGQVRTHGSE